MWQGVGEWGAPQWREIIEWLSCRTMNSKRSPHLTPTPTPRISASSLVKIPNSSACLFTVLSLITCVSSSLSTVPVNLSWFKGLSSMEAVWGKILNGWWYCLPGVLALVVWTHGLKVKYMRSVWKGQSLQKAVEHFTTGREIMNKTRLKSWARVMHARNPSAQDMEAGNLGVPGQPQLQWVWGQLGL